MRYRALIPILGLLVMLFLLAACGGDTPTKADKADPGFNLGEMKSRDKNPQDEATVPVKNVPATVVVKPVLAEIRWDRDDPRQDTGLRIEARVVPENLEKASLRYEFWRNASQYRQGKSNTLEPPSLKKGDVIFADVVLLVDEREMDRKRSEMITVLNSPPEISDVRFPEIRAPGAYQLQIQASDADGDLIAYSLEGENIPAGLAIDKATGVITYQFTETPEGPVQFAVRASDPDGGSMKRDVTIRFKKPEPERTE